MNPKEQIQQEAKEMVPGNKYIIDANFNTGGVVEIVEIGKLFCKVKDLDTNNEWETMSHRLSPIPLWLESVLTGAPAQFTPAEKGHGEGKYISFTKDDWNKWKAKLGQGVYQGDIGVDYITDWLKFLEERALAVAPSDKGQGEGKVYTPVLCPKCHGDGDLLRYNSPAFMSTNARPVCDVCRDAKILYVITSLPATPADVEQPEDKK